MESYLVDTLPLFAMGAKSTSLAAVYGVAALLSLALLVACCLLVRKTKGWFVLLFSSVFVVNLGYTFLSLSTGLEMALWANRVSYLGSVFLPLAMLMILLNVTGTKHPKWLHGALGALAVAVFLITASPGILPIYYEEVSFAVVNGVSTLVKVYGPLHPLYLVYLLGYFAAMVAVVLRVWIKKTMSTTAHAVLLTVAVFANLGVWMIEQLVDIDFEMLSISYIISELFLLGIHLVMNEFQRLNRIVRQIEEDSSAEARTTQDSLLMHPVTGDFSPEKIEVFLMGLNTLTPTEREIYEAYLARATTKEILASMEIKESTLKYHNRNLYGKLGVSTRKELLELHKHILSAKDGLNKTE